MQADTFVYGPRGILRDDIIAGPTYNRENAHLIANAPTWLAELLAEVDRLTSAVHMYADKLAEHECEAAAVAELGVALEETSNNAADYFDRALAAEQAVERVRDLAAVLHREGREMAGLGGPLRQGMGDSAVDAAARILRALDGGEQHG